MPFELAGKMFRAVGFLGEMAAFADRVFGAAGFFATIIIWRRDVAARYREMVSVTGANREIVVRRLKNWRRREDRARVMWRLRYAIVYIILGRALQDRAYQGNG